ncbi:putative Rossmann-fold nucleotide-binding protein [Mesorhizobium jarvisii]
MYDVEIADAPFKLNRKAIKMDRSEAGRSKRRLRVISVPPPPHPLQRQLPLPGQTRKTPADDPGAAGRIEAILASPSYRLAVEDPAFLESDDTRGPRLEIDYLKPEMLLRQHRIRGTIVVFGSTRICEPVAARRNLSALRSTELVQPPADVSLRLRAAERIASKARYYDVARQFGRLVSGANRDQLDHQIVIMTGSGPGIMEAANRGAFDLSMPSVGLNISLPNEQYPNPYVSPELCFQVHYFAIRKLHFLLRAKALVAFPGGFGTLDELFENPHPCSDPQDQANSSRPGWQGVLAPCHRHGFPGGGRSHRSGGSRPLLVCRNGGGNLGGYTELACRSRRGALSCANGFSCAVTSPSGAQGSAPADRAAR